MSAPSQFAKPTALTTAQLITLWQAAFPEEFPADDDSAPRRAARNIEYCFGDDVGLVCDLLGRVLHLTCPLLLPAQPWSGLEWHYALGSSPFTPWGSRGVPTFASVPAGFRPVIKRPVFEPTAAPESIP